MPPLEDNRKPHDREERVEVRELQALLRKSLDASQLQVIEYTATNLLPLGENYCSIMLKIDVVIRRDKRTKDEKLYLVAKTPTPDMDKHKVDWRKVFGKEVYLYADLVPMYRKLQQEVGIEENELIDILAKYFGHRNSLDENSDKIDNHSLVLMENLKVLDFYLGNRFVGLDVDHCRIALKELARYHALGISLKRKRPEVFEKAVAQARVLGFDFEGFNKGLESTLQPFREFDCFSKYLPVIEASFDNMRDGKTYSAPLEEPWATITHGDFWVNNMMFHKDENGNVDRVKFVDFQTYLPASALKDLPYFINGSIDKTTLDNHLDELLDLYYCTFVNTLERMRCNTSAFTRQRFDEELKMQAIKELPLCALAMKFFDYEKGEDDTDPAKMISTVFDSKCSKNYKNKLMKLIDCYEKRGWFDH